MNKFTAHFRRFGQRHLLNFELIFTIFWSPLAKIRKLLVCNHWLTLAVTCLVQFSFKCCLSNSGIGCIPLTGQHFLAKRSFLYCFTVHVCWCGRIAVQQIFLLALNGWLYLLNLLVIASWKRRWLAHLSDSLYSMHPYFLILQKRRLGDI